MEGILSIIDVQDKIIELRGQHVMLDADVAKLYGVETKIVNQAVKNNPQKFPKGYVIALDDREKNELVKIFDRFGNLKHSTVAPKAFTERGLYMLATILKSERAVQATLSIVETFAKVRELRRDLLELHKSAAEGRTEAQKTIMNRFGEVLSDIVMPELKIDETESSLELNFFIGKLKHTVKRRRTHGEDEVG